MTVFVTDSSLGGFYSGMVPNLAFNCAMAAIFGIYTLFHLIVLIPYKQWWFGTCFVIMTLMELIGYIGRAQSHSDLNDRNAFLQQYVCLTIAPVFAMAGIYYQLAKLSMIYGPEHSRLRPMAYSYIFIGFDICSILVQAAGGGIASSATGDNGSAHTRDVGSHIFTAGLALQVLSMAVFMAFYIDFMYAVHIRIKKRNPGVVDLDSLYNPKFAHIRQRKGFKYFTSALFIAVIFIFIRSCYRVAELAEGWSGMLMTHEIYFVILDALMVSIATLILIPFYPGFIFDGRHTNVGVQGFKKSFKKNERGGEEEQQRVDEVESAELQKESDISTEA